MRIAVCLAIHNILSDDEESGSVCKYARGTLAVSVPGMLFMHTLLTNERLAMQVITSL